MITFYKADDKKKKSKCIRIFLKVFMLSSKVKIAVRDFTLYFLIFWVTRKRAIQHFLFIGSLHTPNSRWWPLLPILLQLTVILSLSLGIYFESNSKYIYWRATF